MSTRSRERHRNKEEYFAYLHETTCAVDPYVEQAITSQGLIGELVSSIRQRFRFGKAQLRPATVRMAFEAVNESEDWMGIIPACAALEMKDTAYYCFDDIFDHDADPRELMLTGYACSTVANSMILDLKRQYSSSIVERVMREILRLDGMTVQGGLADLRIADPDTTEEQYMDRPQCFNFWEHAMKVGTMLGCSDETLAEKMGQAGRKIGIAYIIANDTWDFGKDLEDVTAGRYTLPIIFALRNARTDIRELLARSMHQPLDEKQKQDLRRMIVECGAIDYGKHVAWAHCEQAMELLKDLPKSKAKALMHFSMTMTQRNKYYDAIYRMSDSASIHA